MTITKESFETILNELSSPTRPEIPSEIWQDMSISRSDHAFLMVIATMPGELARLLTDNLLILATLHEIDAGPEALNLASLTIVNSLTTGPLSTIFQRSYPTATNISLNARGIVDAVNRLFSGHS